VVTLDAEARPTVVLPVVVELLASPSLAAFAVKDSFRTIDLATLGFLQLFEASWIWKEPTLPRSGSLPIRWLVVQEPNVLASWEAAWWRSAAPPDATPKPRLFPATLLDTPEVAFIAGFTNDRLVAGCALAFSDSVVGVSCSFYETPDLVATESALLSAIHGIYPDRPVVGYESGERLEASLLCGFEPVGPLRVWFRNQPCIEA